MAQDMAQAMPSLRLRRCDRDRACPRCGGTGTAYDRDGNELPGRDCARCGGSGSVECDGDLCDCCLTCEACGSLDLALTCGLAVTCRACAWQRDLDDGERWHLDGGRLDRRYVQGAERTAEIAGRLVAYAGRAGGFTAARRIFCDRLRLAGLRERVGGVVA